MNENEKTETTPIKAELVTDESAVSEITLILPLKKKLEELETAFDKKLDSGGATYTPEKFEWKDMTKERKGNLYGQDNSAIYTNDSGVPLYIQIFADTDLDGTPSLTLFIEDDRGIMEAHAKIGGRSHPYGREEDEINRVTNGFFYIIPEGKKYQIDQWGSEGKASITKWYEAKMPVAIAANNSESYSAKEVDKKLAIKDKLIEKLSARLDALEKKLKKTK